MKRLIPLLLLLTTTAFGDVRIKDFQVRQGNVPGLREVNIRILVDNPGATTQQGPIEITLMGRRHGGEWSPLQSWQVPKLPAGYQVARDYFSRVERDFELRAVVSTPGGQTDERTWP